MVHPLRYFYVKNAEFVLELLWRRSAGLRCSLGERGTDSSATILFPFKGGLLCRILVQVSAGACWCSFSSCSCSVPLVCQRPWRQAPPTPHPSFLLPLHALGLRFLDTRVRPLWRVPPAQRSATITDQCSIIPRST